MALSTIFFVNSFDLLSSGTKYALSIAKTRIMKNGYLLAMATLLLAMGCNAQSRPINTNTVSSLDLKRYMGRWYEIARYDHSFERNLDECEAFYSLLPDGKISVVNTGVNSKTGKHKSSYGKAKAGRKVGQLRVSFFWIFYSDYNILALGDNYDWALVGSSSPKYLWILSRTPHLSDTTLAHIIKIAEYRGYDTSKLIYVKQ